MAQAPASTPGPCRWDSFTNQPHSHLTTDFLPIGKKEDVYKHILVLQNQKNATTCKIMVVLFFIYQRGEKSNNLGSMPAPFSGKKYFSCNSSKQSKNEKSILIPFKGEKRKTGSCISEKNRDKGGGN